MMVYALGAIAQLVAHLNGIEGVRSSNLLSSIDLNSDYLFVWLDLNFGQFGQLLRSICGGLMFLTLRE